MTVLDHETNAMRRAFVLASNGPRGLNPQVGAVILSPTGHVIAEGWHRGSGTPHAEVDALGKIAPGAAAGATAIVTLEPCNHTGRTGPCAQALLDAGIARVIYSVTDPGQASSGGAARLRSSGVDVVGGVAADEGVALLHDWLTVQRLGRPHITLKWAQSLDGRAAAADGTSKWITGPAARADVHERRSRADAIIAGTGTIFADDPALTARHNDGTLYKKQPRPVALGRREVPSDAAVHQHPLPLLTYPGHDLHAALSSLRDEGVQRVFVEGGPTVIAAFLRAGLVDEALIYIAPTLIGRGSSGADVTAIGAIGVETIIDQRRLQMRDVHRLGDDLLVIATPAEKES